MCADWCAYELSFQSVRRLIFIRHQQLTGRGENEEGSLVGSLFARLLLAVLLATALNSVSLSLLILYSTADCSQHWLIPVAAAVCPNAIPLSLSVYSGPMGDRVVGHQLAMLRVLPLPSYFVIADAAIVSSTVDALLASYRAISKLKSNQHLLASALIGWSWSVFSKIFVASCFFIL